MEDNSQLIREINRIIERLDSLCDKPGSHFEDQRNRKKQGTVRGLVSVVLFAGKNAPHLKTCIQNIRRHTTLPYEIICVANPSSEETIKRHLKLKPNNKIDYQVVFCSENLEPAKACNDGINKSRGEYIVLLSPNAIVAKNWVSGMLECLRSFPDAGIVGTLINLPGISKQLIHTKQLSIKIIQQLAEKIWKNNRHRRIRTYTINNSCMLFTRKLFKRIGGFDENFAFEAGFREDFCVKAALEGKTNLTAGDVYVHRRQTNFPHKPKKYFKRKWQNPDPGTRSGKKFLTLTAVKKGLEAYQKDDLDAAIKFLMEGIQRSPFDPLPYFELGAVLLQSHNFKDALNVIRELPAGANEVRKNEMLGCCSLGLNLDQDALQFAQRAISIDQESAPAYNLLGLLAQKQGNKEKAASFFEQSATADPGYGEPFTNLGSIFVENSPDKALNYIERGFILSPHIPDILTAYHSIITAVGEYERAEPVFESAVSAYPLNKILRYRFMDVLYRRGKLEEALNQIQETMVRFGSEEGMMAAALKIREMADSKQIPKSKNAGKTALSICLITKNEETFLPACLHSVTPIADEIILVDTGSTDQTKGIATIFGARVYDFKWNEDFSKARNFALTKATGEWIFVLDADEVISPLDYERFTKIIKNKPDHPTGYSMVTRNYVTPPDVTGWTWNDGQYPEEERGTGWHPSQKVRLFPNDRRIRFENPIHEIVETSLMRHGIEIKQCDIPVHHYGQLDWENYMAKGERYYCLGKKKLAEKGEDLNALIELATQAGGAFGKYKEAVELWKRVLKIDSQNTKALINMGSALMRLKEYKAALEASETALELDPGLKGAVMNSTLCELLLGGDLGKIITKLEKLLNNTPDYPAAMALLGSVYAIDGERGKAVEKTESLGAQGFSRDYYLHDLAQKLIAAEQSKKAVSLLQFAVESGNASDEIRELLRSLKISGQ